MSIKSKLSIYNTRSRQKEPFEPVNPKKVTLYVCGPTVYQLLHIGNFRGAIFFNLVKNWLLTLEYGVKYVYNFTDIDDKIIQKANEEGVVFSEISERFIEEFKQDFNSLGLVSHDVNPKATSHIGSMIQMIQKLIDSKKAYVIDGEVFFSIDQFDDYGHLSQKSLEDLKAGARVEPDPRKRNPLDFVLWKPSKPDEPYWEAPFGNGRPGWHIECSVMIKDHLGDTIDIHGGGIDLIFPHHENEIAQSESCTNKRPFAKYWMHHQFIQINNEKMSKSLGNVINTRKFVEEFDPEVLKFLVLSVHYRSLLNINPRQIYQTLAALHRIYSALLLAETSLENFKNARIPSDAPDKNLHLYEAIFEQSGIHVTEALNDDFNTPLFFQVVFDRVRDFNQWQISEKKNLSLCSQIATLFKEWLLYWGSKMSLFQQNPLQFLNKMKHIYLSQEHIDPAWIEAKIIERSQARQQKNWEISDKIRDELKAKGILLMDSPVKTSWDVDFGRFE